MPCPGRHHEIQSLAQSSNKIGFFMKGRVNTSLLLELTAGTESALLIFTNGAFEPPKSLNQLAEFFLMNEGPRSEILTD